MIKYHNAKDKDGNIVPIEDALSRTTYYCIGCGKEMIAKKGKIKEHHYSHKQTLECNAETYLHKYAKHYIKKLFDTQEHFFISYLGDEECNKVDTCTYREISQCYCSEVVRSRYDLKKYYDTCDLEAENGGYIADVLLRSSTNPERKPCFIEIAVTHPCEENKIKSGIKIVEIQIPKDSDNFEAINLLSETRYDEYYRGSRKHIQTKFFNFKKNKRANYCLNTTPVTVFFINANGKAQVCIHDNCCSSYGIRHLEHHSLYEIHFPFDSDFMAYKKGLAIATLSGKSIKNCWLCQHHWYSELWSKHHCIHNHAISSPSDATQCPYYSYARWKAHRFSENISLPYKIVEPTEEDNTLF